MVAKRKNMDEALVSEEINPTAPQGQELGPLTFNLAIGREKNLLSVSHTIAAADNGGIKDITLILEAMGQITNDLQETLIQLRVQQAVAEVNQDQKAAKKPNG